MIKFTSRILQNIIMIFILFLIYVFQLSCNNKKDCSRVLYTDSLTSYEGYVPEKGYVPDEKTAITIATAVWSSFYGNIIDESKPFKASLIKDSIWYVRGAIKIDTCTREHNGIPHIEIDKKSGKIIRMIFDR